MKYGLGIRTWNVRTLLGTSTLADLLLVHGIFAVGWPDSGKFSYVEELKSLVRQVLRKEKIE